MTNPFTIAKSCVALAKRGSRASRFDLDFDFGTLIRTLLQRFLLSDS